MKKIITVQSIILALLCLLLAAGCAKKAPMDTQVSSSDTLSEAPQTAPVVQDVPVKEAVVTPVTLNQILFSFDQFSLTPEARDTLAANAIVLETAPALKVGIEGHCDDRGSDEYNLALGERRAQAVKDYLMSLGVAPERMETISYGEEMPANKGKNKMAWAKNRRAEFKVIN
jgi:peptidoglycan-associated lipoprotein